MILIGITEVDMSWWQQTKYWYLFNFKKGLPFAWLLIVLRVQRWNYVNRWRKVIIKSTVFSLSFTSEMKPVRADKRQLFFNFYKYAEYSKYFVKYVVTRLSPETYGQFVNCRLAEMFYHMCLEHRILLHPQYFGPRLIDIVKKKLFTEVEGSCTGWFLPSLLFARECDRDALLNF